jgi:hypothetical protein
MLGKPFLWQRESWRAFWRQPGVVVPLSLAVLIILTTWVVVLTAPTPFENSLRLRYSIYVGTNWLTGPRAFWLVPGFATLCVLSNVAFAYTIARRTLVLRYFWLWSAVVVALGWFWLAVLLRQFNS